MKVFHRLGRLLCVAALLAMVGAAMAQEPVVRNTAKGLVAVQLDAARFGADEPITGKLVFQISEVRSSTGKLLDAISLHRPSLTIQFADEMAAVPYQVRWRTVFLPTVKVGHRYELAFTISADPAFAALVKRENESLILFKPGKYAISAIVDSPARVPWDPPGRSPFVELHQQFQGEAKEITITSAIGQEIGAAQAKRAAGQAQGDLRHQIVAFYAKRKILSREDLLATADEAQGRAKADLASLYLALEYPAKDLTFFEPVGESISLKGHTGTPRYLMARPRQRVRFICDLAQVHRLRLDGHEEVLTTKKQFDLDMPRAEGVYELYDDVHKQAWGWVLVITDRVGIAAGGLRPDTEALALKVAAALHAQDAKALGALAAPGFRVDDAIRRLRFQLGDGDVRFHQSTGTSSRAKATLRINIAAKGSEPVYASELRLDFVLVGDELKLTDAKVWDVER